MSEDIPFEIHDAMNQDILLPNSLGTDHPTVGSFDALVIIGHIVRNLQTDYDIDYDIDDIPNHRYEHSTITHDTQLYSTTDGTHTLCPICQEDFVVDDEVMVLECDHVFHGSCIGEWGHYKGTCPICRTDVEKENPE